MIFHHIILGFLYRGRKEIQQRSNNNCIM